MLLHHETEHVNVFGVDSKKFVMLKVENVAVVLTCKNESTKRSIQNDQDDIYKMLT